MSLTDIVEGHLNELLGKHRDLSEKRLLVCKACPLWIDTAAGPFCNPNKWIDKNNKSSDEYFEGAIKGCGCRLTAKTALKHAQCIIGKW